MSERYLWIFERHGRLAHTGVDVAEDLISILHSQKRSAVMSSDRISRPCTEVGYCGPRLLLGWRLTAKRL
jgi:hypothetical protein